MTAIPIERILSTTPLDLGGGTGALGIPAAGPDTSFRDHLRDQNRVPARRDDDESTGSSTQPPASTEPGHDSLAEGTQRPSDDNSSENAADESRPANDTLPTEADAAETPDETASPSDTADVAATDAERQTTEQSPAATDEGRGVARDDASNSADTNDSTNAASRDGSTDAEEARQTKIDPAAVTRQSAAESASAEGGENPAVSEGSTLLGAEGLSAEGSGNSASTTGTPGANPDGQNGSSDAESAAARRTANSNASGVTGDSQAKIAAEDASASVAGAAVGDEAENTPSTDDRRDGARKSGRQENAVTSNSIGTRTVPRGADGATANRLTNSLSNATGSSQVAAESVPAVAGGDAESTGANAAASHAAADASPVGAAASTTGRTPAQLFSRGTDRAGSPERLGDIETTRLVQRVSRAFKAAESRGGEVRLRLSPPELGTLRIEVRVDAGIMRARLEAETYVARNALLDNLSALRDRLAEQDIRIEQFDVDLMDRRSGDQPENANRRPAPSPTKTTDNAPASKTAEGDPAPDDTPAGTWPTEDGGINVIA